MTCKDNGRILPPLPPASKDDECQIVQDLLPLYVDGIASPASNALVEAHTAGCSGCKALLDSLREELPAPSAPLQQDLEMESALKNVNRSFHRKNTIITIIGVIAIIAMCAAGFIFMDSTHLPARDVTVKTIEETSESLTLSFGSPVARVDSVNVAEGAQGYYDVIVSSYPSSHGKNGSKTAVFDKPVNQIEIDDDIIYQDGVHIYERCRSLYPYANGFAGSTAQMSLAFPNIYPYTFTIEADTYDDQNCIWTYIAVEGNADPANLVITKEYLDAYRKAALLALALTPNLEEIRLRYPDGSDKPVAARHELHTLLAEKGLTPVIENYADLQRIIDAIYGPAG